MIVNAGYRGKVGAAAPKFTYTGQYNVRDDGVVELLTSGTIVFLEPKVIDVFMVGGGGSGYSLVPNSSSASPGGLGGGGGGYTRTIKRLEVQKMTNIPIIIGDGGIAPTKFTAAPGGYTSWGDLSVSGGLSKGGTSLRNGRNGGSGGGAGAASTSTLGTGGSDGNSGTASSGTGGSGQGSTTREFGEPNGKLYAGGGGG